MPFNSELPNGWSVRFSSCPINNAQNELTEFGIDPDIEVHCDDIDLAKGQDAILDAALDLFAPNDK